MNILSNLRPADGSVKKRKRIGRGQGSGHGGTSTRGMNGNKARSGYKSKRGHEGGQTPIQMRLPKRGFKNINRIDYVALNLEALQSLAEKHHLMSIDFDILRQHKVIKHTEKFKVLSNGALKLPLRIKAHAFSASAKEAIEAVGGVAELIK